MASEQVKESPGAAAQRWLIASEQYHAELVRVRAERGEWMARAISRGKENDELRDEIARLRRAFPIDRLREYDRRKRGTACSKCNGTGKIHFMNMHPEDYEPPAVCGLCDGTGERKEAA